MMKTDHEYLVCSRCRGKTRVGVVLEQHLRLPSDDLVVEMATHEELQHALQGPSRAAAESAYAYVDAYADYKWI